MTIVWKIYIPTGINPTEVTTAISTLLQFISLVSNGSLIEVEMSLPKDDYKESFFTFGNYIARAIEVTFHAKVRQYTRSGDGDQLIAI